VSEWPDATVINLLGGVLAEGGNTAGHANVSITSGYFQVAVEDKTGIRSLFECP